MNQHIYTNEISPQNRETAFQSALIVVLDY